MKKRYGVVLAYDGHKSNAVGEYAGRFKRFDDAAKERDLQNRDAWFRVDSPADLLGKGSFKYRWRVWDHFNRCFADNA